MQTDLAKFVAALAAAFAIPLLTFLLGVVWSKFVGGWRSPRIGKGWATACLAMPIVILAMILRFGYESLRTLWAGSPVVFSFLYLVVGLLIPAALIVSIVRLWRPDANPPRGLPVKSGL